MNAGRICRDDLLPIGRNGQALPMAAADRLCRQEMLLLPRGHIPGANAVAALAHERLTIRREADQAGKGRMAQPQGAKAADGFLRQWFSIAVQSHSWWLRSRLPVFCLGRR